MFCRNIAGRAWPPPSSAGPRPSPRNGGEDTVYNYVHPNNDGVIAFLRSMGYSVLNLIEIRKPYAGETLTTTIPVGAETFDY